MSDSNRIRLGVIRETAGLGKTDAVSTANGGSNIIAVRPTSDGIVYNKTTAQSAEIRPDRNIVDLVPIGGQVGGTIGFEFHEPHPASDALIFLESLMCNKLTLWGNAVGTDRIQLADGTLAMTVHLDGTASITTSVLLLNHAFIVVRGCNDARDGVWQVTDNTNGSLAPIGSHAFGTPAGVLPAGSAVIVASIAISGTLTLTVTGSTGTLASSNPIGVSVGSWIALRGTDNAASDGIYHVGGLTNGGATMVLDVVPAGAQSGNITTGNLCISYSMVNGTQKNSFTINDTVTDTTPHFTTTSAGCLVDSAAFSFDTTAIANGTYTLMGLTQIGADGDGIGVAAQPLTSRSMSSRANVAQFNLGSQTLTGLAAARSLTLNVQNNLRAQAGIGSYDLVGIGQGDFVVSGTASVYFQNGSTYEAFKNDQNISLSMTIGVDGAFTVFTMPKIRQSENSHPARGKNQDLTAEIAFTALYDASIGGVLKLDYFPYAG